MATMDPEEERAPPSAVRRLFERGTDLLGKSQSIRFLEIASAVMLIVVGGIIVIFALVGFGVYLVMYGMKP